MKIIFTKILLIGIAFCVMLFEGSTVAIAGDEACTDPSYPVCWGTATVNQHSCNIGCAQDEVPTCTKPGGTCGVGGDCGYYGGICVDACPAFNEISECASTGTQTVGCNTSMYNCGAYVSISDCQYSGQDCTGVETTTHFFSCCGGGSVPPTPTPTATASPTGSSGSTPSCSVTFSSPSYTLSSGATIQIAPTITGVSGGSVSSVYYASSVGIISVNPTETSSSPYTTNVTGVSTGTEYLTTSVALDGVVRCVASTSINVSNSAWWQVKDSDVVGSNINSYVPVLSYFSEAGPGGFPGVPIYGSSTNLTNTSASEKGWIANSSHNSSRIFNSTYFINRIPQEIIDNESSILSTNTVSEENLTGGGALYNGYYWYIYDGTTLGDLTINSNVDLGTRKVILIVKNAGMNINGRINLTDASGFFLSVVNGDIDISASVGGSGAPDIEGVYISDGVFNTGTGSEENDLSLWIRGSVAGYGGVNLQRDLGDTQNGTTPAEYFEYAPDQELLFPISLAYKATNWREVAP